MAPSEEGVVLVLKDYLLPLVLSAGLTAALGPAAIFAGRRLGVLDRPGGRRVNEKPVPRLGGLAIFGGFMLALALTPSPPGARAGAVFAGTAAFVLGFLDDLYDLKPGIKLAGQIFTASILPLCGISIRYLTNPWGGMFDLGWLAGPATVFWVVALMNMINLIDGLDGLAAGVCAIAAVNLLFLPQCVQRPFVALLCLLTIGCAAGFLPYNFHPARTFMGDGGSHFLGFVLGFITVAGALKGRAALTMSIPFLALAVPFFDTALAVFRRCQNGQSIFTGDRGHLHHRLLYLGFNHRQTVLLLYACSAVFGIGSNFLARLAAHLGVTLLTGLLICAAWGLHRVGVDRAAWHGRTHQSLPPQR